MGKWFQQNNLWDTLQYQWWSWPWQVVWVCVFGHCDKWIHCKKASTSENGWCFPWWTSLPIQEQVHGIHAGLAAARFSPFWSAVFSFKMVSAGSHIVFEIYICDAFFPVELSDNWSPCAFGGCHLWKFKRRSFVWDISESSKASISSLSDIRMLLLSLWLNASLLYMLVN